MKTRQFRATLTGTLVGLAWGGYMTTKEIKVDITSLRDVTAKLYDDGDFRRNPPPKLDVSSVITITMTKGKYTRTQWVPLTRFKSLKGYIYERKSTRAIDARTDLTAA